MTRSERAVDWLGYDDIDEDYDESPFCECGEQPIEEEEFCGRCFACGKPLQ